jgi:hypothetical protein
MMGALPERLPGERAASPSIEARHREILRLTILGWSPDRISVHLDMSKGGVLGVLRSPMARARLAEMQEEADRMTLNVPLRAALESEMRGATVEAVRLRRRLMNDANVSTNVRAKISEHFVDRMVFDKTSDDGESSYREILRRLDEMDRQVGQGVWLLPSAESEASSTPTSPGEVGRELDPLTNKLREMMDARFSPRESGSAAPPGPDQGEEKKNGGNGSSVIAAD